MPLFVVELLEVALAGVALVSRALTVISVGLWVGRMVWRAISERHRSQ